MSRAERVETLGGRGDESPRTGQRIAELPSNSAAMREALKKCILYITCAESVGIGTITLNDKVKLGPKKIIKSAKEALAAPPRNCDRFGSYAEARAEWWKTEVLPRVDGVVSGAEPPFDEWLFAPAAERKGDSDGSK